jgi:hypothetical protein
VYILAESFLKSATRIPESLIRNMSPVAKKQPSPRTIRSQSWSHDESPYSPIRSQRHTSKPCAILDVHVLVLPQIMLPQKVKRPYEKNGEHECEYCKRRPTASSELRRSRVGSRTVDSRQSIALPRRWRPKSSAPHRLSGSAARSHSVPPFW